MIAVEKFLFIHLHKSGGTFINMALKKYAKGFRFIGYHLPYTHAPDEIKTLPVVGIIRNPWDFYVSFYHFQISFDRPNIVYRVFSDNGRYGFQDTIKNMCEPENIHFNNLSRLAPKSFPNRNVNLTKDCVDELRKMEGGWFSRLFIRSYRGCEPIFIRQESLRRDLICVVARFSQGTSEGFEEYVQKSNKLNMSDRGLYREYYDEKLSNIVLKSHQEIIKRFSYVF